MGPDHPDVASSLSSLAILYAQQKRFDAAMPLQSRALAIRRQAFGTSHPDVADSLSALSSLHRARKHFVEAERLASEALTIAEERLGPDHHMVGKILDNLAAAYLGDPEQFWRIADPKSRSERKVS